MDRYNRFKEIGFEKWVEEQTQKAKEGYEIHLQKVAALGQYLVKDIKEDWLTT